METLLASASKNAGPSKNAGHGQADNAPGARGLVTGEPNEPLRRTWSEVHEEARHIAGALRATTQTPRVDPGDAVAVLAAAPGLIAPAVQAVWLAGGSITMLHQPTPRTDLQEWARDTVRILQMIGARLVLLGPPFDDLAGLLEQNDIPYRQLGTLEHVEAAPLEQPVDVPEDATALLQLTSGSTAAPKAVRISHGNLYANLRAMEQAVELDPDRDVVVSWLPLFHDMGMVGCLTVPMAIGMEAVKITPADFLARPLLWPELITRYRGTVTAAPNFAYAIVGRRLSTADDGAFDLSSMRFTLNGAEPIDPDAAAAFTAAGARFGLRDDVMLCAFGMAEATLAVSMAPLHQGLAVDSIDADELERQGRAVRVEPEPTGSGQVRTRRFPLLGPPLPGIDVQAVDQHGNALPEREVGQLRIRGEAVTSEYLTENGPVPTQDADGWLDTGDEGYLTDGQIVICGRRKDVIIMGGRNIYPVDIERAASGVEGVRAGNAVAVRHDPGTRREGFSVVLESRLAGDETAEKALRKEVTARVVDAVGVRPSTVVVLSPGTLPKTPSGKLRRSATSDLIPGRTGT